MDALTGQQRRRIGETLAHDVWGTVKEVGEELRGVGKRLGVSEFVVTGDMPDVAGRARSEELLASLQADSSGRGNTSYVSVEFISAAIFSAGV